jgi:transposase
VSVLSAASAGGAFINSSSEGGLIIMAQHPAEITGGVDTHKDAHVAAAVDAAGRLLGTAEFSADAAGYRRCLGWLESHGPLARVGVEGTGSYGAGLARHLAAAGVEVVEVNRPNRQMRRRRGKTDTVDAEAAARAALCGQAAVTPKAADGPVEAIRMLQAARRSAVKARTQAANQICAVIVTAPDSVKHRLKALSTRQAVEVCAQMRPGAAADVTTAAARTALRALARRHQALTAEIDSLDAELTGLCEKANPALLQACGVGTEVASALLVAASDNPERMRSESAFAALCGANPIEASSGKTTRHRLNRSGNRQANNALWRIAITRLRADPRTIDYASRRQAEGKTRREIIRCLKRHIAREIYRLLTDPPPVPHGPDLRRHRTRLGLTITATAQALNTAPTRISALEQGKYHNRDLAERYQQHLTHNESPWVW